MSEKTDCLYVRKIDRTFTDEEIRTIFDDVSPVKDVKIMKTNGNSRGYGYIRFNSIEGAEKAMETMKTKYVGQNRLKMSFAKRCSHTPFECGGSLVPDEVKCTQDVSERIKPIKTFFSSNLIKDINMGLNAITMEIIEILPKDRQKAILIRRLELLLKPAMVEDCDKLMKLFNQLEVKDLLTLVTDMDLLTEAVLQSVDDF